MAEGFNFDAPQFVDFNVLSVSDSEKTGDENNVEAYFEVNHENDPLQMEHEIDSECATGIETKTNYKSGKKPGIFLKSSGKNGVRRSISHDNFFSIKSKEKAKVKQSPSNNSLQTTPNKTKKFVSSAEFINKFQNQTPDRFRTRPANHVPEFSKGAIPKQTIPRSPKLTTKQRTKSMTNFTPKELEETETQEQKKQQINRKPLYKYSPLVSKKTCTKVEPFKFTKPVQKKVAVPNEPLPKITGSKPRPLIKPPLLTQLASPKFLETSMKKQEERNKEQKAKEKVVIKPTKTIPQPFAFMEREEARRRQNEMKFLENLKQQQENEKQAREFRARQFPHYRNFNKGSTETIKSEGKPEVKPPPPFRARSAEVLNKPPFIPEIPKNHVIHVEEFQLASERRAAERREFNRRLQEKEEMENRKKQLDEKRRLLEQEQEKVRLRKEAEFKAQPVKKFKEFNIVPAKKITNPVSPNFSKKNKK